MLGLFSAPRSLSTRLAHYGKTMFNHPPSSADGFTSVHILLLWCSIARHSLFQPSANSTLFSSLLWFSKAFQQSEWVLLASQEFKPILKANKPTLRPWRLALCRCIASFQSWSTPRAVRTNTEMEQSGHCILISQCCYCKWKSGKNKKNSKNPQRSKSKNKCWITIFFTRLKDIPRRIKNIYQPMLTISLSHSWQQLEVKLCLRESYFGLISQRNYFPPKGMTHGGGTAVLWGSFPQTRQTSNNTQDFASGTLLQPCPSASWLKKPWNP